MRKIIYVCFTLMLIAGCQNDVSFDKPQPPDTKPVYSFPDRVQGVYTAPDGPQVLHISDKVVYSVYEYQNSYGKYKLDSSLTLIGDTLINKVTGERDKITMIGDSLIIHRHEQDTLFAVSDTGVLKKYKGYYFLNRKRENNNWLVYRMSLEKSMLIVGRINDSADIALLKEISESSKDSAGEYIFRPTQKQFSTYLKRDGFKDRDTFFRVK